MKKHYIVAFFSVRGGDDSEQRNSDQLQLFSEFPVAAPRTDDLKVMSVGSPEPSLHSRHNPHHIFAAESSASPEIPTLRITGEISNFDITMRGRFLRATLPAGYAHCRRLKLVPECSLIQV